MTPIRGRVVWDVMSSFLCGISSKALDRRTACQPVLEKTGWQPVLPALPAAPKRRQKRIVDHGLDRVGPKSIHR